ncbi:oligomeric complex COG6 [Rhizopus microsporus var. microsporus]|uniref:Conserved oligomeric Golgi complex subunit 6 n=1 Tax=Rhizopus microsporus var. microsporus TaxID=86635 RepID=A0A1X0QQA0_RHIZD|nr:oligomeric complex COG6 [Rhizopus microsporus var. microsporus]
MESPQRTPTAEDGPTLSISNKPNKSIASKLNKILNSSTVDDTRTKLALTSLSDIPGLDEASLRRNLRGTIEKKEVETNKKFLETFGKVVMQFDKLQSQAKRMQDTCTIMKQQLSRAESETTEVIEQANIMQEQSSAYSDQIAIIDKFIEKFSLSEQEISILNTPSEPVNDEFFVALDHLQQIHKDCQLLLTTKNQKAGREIMDSLAQYQENAYDKLYKWTQYESRLAFGGDIIDVSALMAKALKALMRRPVLFQTILDELAAARHDAVARAFLNALTRGGPGGTPRPIELQAPDPLRYVGDMLAWVHQACAGEKEMLESLFQKNNEKYQDTTGVIVQVSDTVDDLLECAMEGTCRPLKSRIEQVLVLQPNAITSYRLANLVQFYSVTLRKLMRKDASLERVLHEMTGLAYKHFFQTLNAQAERLREYTEPPGRNLAITPTVRGMITQLKEILASYDSSLIVVTNNTDNVPEYSFSEILDAIIEPLLHTCELSVVELKPIDQHIYLVNCLHYIQNVLFPYSFTEAKRESISVRLNDILNDIAMEEYNSLLSQAKLAEIKETLANKDPEIPLSSLPDMDTVSLTNALSKLDSSLVILSADVSPRLDKLASAQHYQHVQSAAIRLLLDTYSEISKAVQDPKNGYEDPDSILPRTVEDMEAIFSFCFTE